MLRTGAMLTACAPLILTTFFGRNRDSVESRLGFAPLHDRNGGDCAARSYPGDYVDRGQRSRGTGDRCRLLARFTSTRDDARSN